MRSILICTVLFILVLLPGAGQSPGDGHVQANAYVNPFFHYSYAWPAFLQPVPTPSLSLPHQASPNEFLLFTARQGTEPFGIILAAEKLHVPTQHDPVGLKNGQDFLDRVLRVPDPSRRKVLTRTHMQGSNGLNYDKLDYLDYNQFTSAIATQVGQYLLVFRCNAKSRSDLDAMTKSVLASRRLN